MIYLPIIGALLESSGTIIEKRLLKKPSIKAIPWTVFGFLCVILVMLPLIYFFWRLDKNAYSPLNLLIFLGVILSAMIANLLVFYSIKRETITELEPVTLLQPLMTIVLAYIFSFFFVQYQNEGNIRIVILGVIASIALVVSHLKKHHITFNKYILAALIGGFLFSVELVLSKLILAYYSSLTFYFLRCVAILILTWIIFRPKMNGIDKTTKLWTLLISIIWVVYRLIVYYGYEKIGVVFTTTLFILSPVFLFIFAAVFLKEKIQLRNLISTIIILACVLISVIPDYWIIISISAILLSIITSIIYNSIKKKHNHENYINKKAMLNLPSKNKVKNKSKNKISKKRRK